MTTLLERYTLPAPYSFTVTARAAHYASTLGAWHDGRYRRAFRAGGGVALVELAGVMPNGASEVEAFMLAKTGNVDRDALRASIASMLNLSLDLAPFYARAEADTRLWPVVAPLRGLGLFLTESVFEALALTVIEQQISLAAAQRAERWLTAWAGEGIRYGGAWYGVFPSAERLAVATVDDLTPLKITFRRMSVLIDLAKREQEQSFDRLRVLPLEDAYQTLMALSGVGHWTAAWTLARGMGQITYVGSADVALRAAVNAYFFGQPGRADRETTDRLFATYGPDAGLASFYTLMRWATERYPPVASSL